MNTPYLEHANVTVKDIADVTRFIVAALPGWAIRGQGTMAWSGKSIRWQHVGTADSYLALQEGGEGQAPDWEGHQVGIKHLGLVVASVDSVVQRLTAAGYTLDHWAGSHAHRRRVYYTLFDGLQFEFIEYLSARDSERHAYEAPASVTA